MGASVLHICGRLTGARGKAMDRYLALSCRQKEREGCAEVIESRCGILCGECEYRALMGCRGCMAIEGPFWGETCPLKACCEGKRLENCGRCDEFPCGLLVQFAFDENQGDGGRRIEQCRVW